MLRSSGLDLGSELIIHDEKRLLTYQDEEKDQSLAPGAIHVLPQALDFSQPFELQPSQGSAYARRCEVN